MLTGRMVLLTVTMLAASVWVGSFVCLIVVSRIALRTLEGPARVALFRGVGRAYGILGTGALVAAIVAGVALAWPLSDADGTVVAIIALAVVLLGLTGAGMAQARRMTRLRRAAIREPDDGAAAHAVARGAAAATVLRTALGVLTLAIVVMGAHVLDRW